MPRAGVAAWRRDQRGETATQAMVMGREMTAKIEK